MSRCAARGDRGGRRDHPVHRRDPHSRRGREGGRRDGRRQSAQASARSWPAALHRCDGGAWRQRGSGASASGPPLRAGATTLDEYRQHIEKDAALERRFQQAVFFFRGQWRRRSRFAVDASLLLPSAGVRLPADGGGDDWHPARLKGAVRATTSHCVAPASPSARKERMSRFWCVVGASSLPRRRLQRRVDDSLTSGESSPKGTNFTMESPSRTRRWWPRRPFPTDTSRSASCPTRRGRPETAVDGAPAVSGALLAALPRP